MMSPLKWQTRVISCFPTGTGFAMGSVEGRVAIQCVYVTFTSTLSDAVCYQRYVDEKDSQYEHPNFRLV